MGGAWGGVWEGLGGGMGGAWGGGMGGAWGGGMGGAWGGGYGRGLGGGGVWEGLGGSHAPKAKRWSITDAPYLPLAPPKSQNALKMGCFGTKNGSTMGQKCVFPKMILDHLGCLNK